MEASGNSGGGVLVKIPSSSASINVSLKLMVSSAGAAFVVETEKIAKKIRINTFFIAFLMPIKDLNMSV
jgi:hypothetical protein